MMKRMKVKKKKRIKVWAKQHPSKSRSIDCGRECGRTLKRPKKPIRWECQPEKTCRLETKRIHYRKDPKKAFESVNIDVHCIDLVLIWTTDPTADGFEITTSAMPVLCSTNWAMKPISCEQVNLLGSFGHGMEFRRSHQNFSGVSKWS